MSIAPSPGATAARSAVASRLRELRLDASLTARRLSALCGWHPAKTSRIEHVRIAPSVDDIRAWCRACGADEEAADLVAASRNAESMYLEWRRAQRTGLRRLQESVVPLYERTRRFRVYCSNVVPGLLQTPGYATALLSSITRFQATPDDVADAVTARMARSRVIRAGDRRFSLIVEEPVLYVRIAGTDVMAAQLDHLLKVMALPSVALGVVPAHAARPMRPLESFTIYDDQRVFVELLTAGLTVSTPREIADYARAFTELSGMAVFGAAARGLVTAAINTFGPG
jgi:transcriptional regulator with XRE-family HTH domain